MKKILILLLVVLLVTLAACQNGQGTEQTPTTTEPAEVEVTTTEEEQTGEVIEEGYSFTLEGVQLVPGQAFDPDALPEAAFIYEVPSCAIEGTDQVYNYETVEVTAYDDGTGPVIYSIYLVDVDTTTEEGLYLGDDLTQVEALYGTDYISDGTQITYTKGETMLILLMENDCVISVEYRMVTE